MYYFPFGTIIIKRPKLLWMPNSKVNNEIKPKFNWKLSLSQILYYTCPPTGSHIFIKEQISPLFAWQNKTQKNARKFYSFIVIFVSLARTFLNEFVSGAIFFHNALSLSHFQFSRAGYVRVEKFAWENRCIVYLAYLLVVEIICRLCRKRSIMCVFL